MLTTIFLGIVIYIVFAYGVDYLFEKASNKFFEMIPDSTESTSDDDQK